ncbi:LysR family transcriptional regulator [Pseudooceanicola aestuarii]|uniref:LysR family transcriptional regulator n=1 Tax=Pseudooceanicola aestuarii TaxID=2697319 RepID=UPI0013D1815B|nr:LysR family transcriptional regulator [Pseudooceanicola aestuarii]
MIDWTRLPPLTALRALAALAETGSTVEAGARLNVSHAAISQQIKQLEAHLGLALVRRGGRQLDLTLDGRALADAVLDGLAGVIEVTERLTGQDAMRPLTISTTPAFASSFLMPRMADFRRRHPGVSLMIDPSPELRDVGPGAFDAAVRYGNGDWPGLAADLLLLTPIAIIGAPELVGHGGPVTPDDLTAYHWLQELGTSEATEFMQAHGATLELRQGVTSLPGNMVLDAARNGQGVAVMARAFAEPDIAAGRLRLLFEDTRKKGYFLVHRPGSQRPLVRAFLRWMRGQVGAVEKMSQGCN